MGISFAPITKTKQNKTKQKTEIPASPLVSMLRGDSKLIIGINIITLNWFHFQNLSGLMVLPSLVVLQSITSLDESYLLSNDIRVILCTVILIKTFCVSYFSFVDDAGFCFQ